MKKLCLFLSFFILIAPSTTYCAGRDDGHSSVSGLSQAKSANIKKVEIFVTSWCGYCKKLERFLSQRNIAYTRYDVEADAHAAEVFRSIGGTGVPVILVGSDVVYGYDPDRVLELLR